jgi:hypothetical protein
MLTTETAGAEVRQTVDRFLYQVTVPTAASASFPKQVVFGPAGITDFSSPRSIQSAMRRARGYAVVRGGVISTIAGTIYVMQSWSGANMNSFAVTYTAALVADPLSGLFALDWSQPISREMVLIRFTASADIATTFEIGAMLLPVGN